MFLHEIRRCWYYEWFPDTVARQLPSPLHFEAVWVVGLQSVEAGVYVYNITGSI